jgi:hypothetical protein
MKHITFRSSSRGEKSDWSDSSDDSLEQLEILGHLENSLYLIENPI